MDEFISLRGVLLAVGVVFCVGYGWLPVYVSAPNERARVYLSVAMVERGEVSVDEEVDTYGGNYDLAERDDHYYSNKPPGASLLGAVSYAAAHWWAGGDWSIQGLLQLMRYTVVLPLALLGFVALRGWLRLLDVSEPVVDVASVGWMLGSAAFHYSAAFFSHQIVAVFLVAALWALEYVRNEVRGPPGAEARVPGWWLAAVMFSAGLMLGIDGLTEYQAGVGCAFVAIWVVSTRELRSLRLLVPFAIGAGICVVVLFYYHTAAFGGPLEFSYDYHGSSSGEPIGFPQWTYFAGLMFSLHRGLFTNAPWSLLMIPGVVLLFRRRHQAGTAVLLAAIILFRIGLLSGYEWWSGDWGFGPRHLVPTMGIMAALAAVAMDRWWSTLSGELVAKALVLAGIVYNQIQGAFLSELPLGAKNPIYDVAIPFYHEGTPSPNVVAIWTDWRGLESLIPLGCVVVAFAVFVLTRDLSRRRRWTNRIAFAVLSLVPTVAFGAYLQSRGPSWRPKARENFSDWMESHYERDLRWHTGDEDFQLEESPRDGRR